MNKNSRKSSLKTAPKKKGKQQNAKSSAEKSDVKNSKVHTSKASENVSEQAHKATSVVNNNNKSANEAPKKNHEPPKPLERSNSFIERTFSKIYNKISGSIENLAKLAKDERVEDKPAATPFKFQRSLTLNSFQLKKNYRKSFLDSRLEKLSEEKICESDKVRTPSTPPQEVDEEQEIPLRRSRSPTNFRQSMPVGSFDNVDFLQPPPKLERSDSFISLIKRKISFNEAKQPATPSMNSNWAMSLQNLQQIDNMVSYEG
jgi:hypothetical protein